MGTDGAGTVAWVDLVGRGIARLTWAGGTWTLERGPFGGANGSPRGRGVELADGTVGFAWPENESDVFDSKGRVRVAWKAGGEQTFRVHTLTPDRDDYATAKIFATPAGLTVGHCIADEPNIFASTGPDSVCHVQTLSSNGAWVTTAGFADRLSPGRAFGIVNGAIVSTVRTGMDVSYVAPNEEPVLIVTRSYAELELADGPLAEPVVVSFEGGNLHVLRPR